MERDTDNDNMDLFDNTVNRVMDLLNFEVVPRNREREDRNIENLLKNLNTEREKRIEAEEKLSEAEIRINLMSGEFGSFISKLFDSFTVDTSPRNHFLRIGAFKSKSERDEWVMKLRNLGATLEDNCGESQDKLKLLKSFNENSMKSSSNGNNEPPPPSTENSSSNVEKSQSLASTKFKKYQHRTNKKRLALKHGIDRQESSPPNKHVCICGNEFGKLKNLCMHIRRTKWTEWRYKCEICERLFFLPSDLRKHMEKRHHVDTYAFSCSYCNMRFETEEDMSSHIRFTHKINSSLVGQLVKKPINGESPSSSSSSFLRKHEEVKISNQDGYLCRCGFSSVSETTLKYHMNLMRGDNTNSGYKPRDSTLDENEVSNVDNIVCID